MSKELVFSPATRRDYGDAGVAAVESALRRGRLSVVFGRDTMSFEASFARFIGVSSAIAVSSGTAALELAFQCLGIGFGDEVVLPAYTFPGTASAVLRNLAIVRFADINPLTFNVDVDTIRAAITDRTKVLVLPHLFGNPIDIGPIVALARARGIFVIEDCAQALGATIDGRRVGSFGDLSVFSFNEIKNLSTGEGGMITTADDAIAERCRLLRLHGMQKGVVVDLGTKCTMTEMEAALGKTLLRTLPEMNARRIEVAERLAQRLAPLPGVRLQRTMPGALNVYSRFVCTIDERVVGISRNDLTSALQERAIFAQTVYPLPIYRNALFVHLAEGNPPSGLPASYRRIYSDSEIWTYYRALDLTAAETFCRSHLGFVLTESATTAEADAFAAAVEGILSSQAASSC